jgi:predicted MFS family arabinose efflux permease
MRGRRVPAGAHAAREMAADTSAPPEPAAARTPTGPAPTPPEPAGRGGAWRLLRTSRELQIIVLVSVLANFVIGGAFEVALPALAHARYGPTGYGAMIACFGIGALAGTLIAARMTGLRKPTQSAGIVFLAGAVAVAMVPFLGGLPGAAGANLVFGVSASFGNIIVVTILQRWAPPDLLGRVMSLILLSSLGSFPAAVALSGVIVKVIGPAPFFPAAGIVFAATVLFALSWRQFRDFGARAESPVGDQAAVVAT